MRPYVVHTAEQLPALLKAYRKQTGLTQTETALRLGVTQQTLSALERNAEKVSVDRMLQLLSILGVDMILQAKHIYPDSEVRTTDETTQW